MPQPALAVEAPPQPLQAAVSPLSLAPTGPSDDEQALAREISDHFRRGKEKRRNTDLWREMLLVHLDGSGDGQYAIILDGGYVGVPFTFGKKLRVQWNLLQPIVANMVKHHASIPFRCTVEMTGTRKQRKKARAASAYGNHIIRDQKLNVVAAEALWMAAAYGHCPIHFQWRHDLTYDAYEPVYLSGEEAAPYMGAMRRGFVDAYVGDPWNTIYNEGATRSSVHRMTYARSLPLSLVQESLKGKAPWVETLKGRTDLPSASRFQRTVRRAMEQAGTGSHGSVAVNQGMKGEEIIVLLCDELLPGMDPKYPRGRLTILALDGVASVDEGTWGGRPVHLHTGPLPAGRLSAIRVYSTDSFDDVLGRPFVANLDDLQISVNQLATLRRERIRRFARTQLLAQAGGLEDDSLTTVDDAILYYTGERPTFLSPPQAEVGLIDNDIRDTLEQMFRIGGWQAASRGEGKAGDAAQKVVALAAADDSIFASSNLHFQETMCEGLQTGCALAKRYMTVPTPLKTTGTDLTYLGEITAEDLPDEPPSFLLTQGSASPEARLQQNLNLVTTKGADGIPLMTTQQFHDANPDPSLRPVVPEVEKQRRFRPILIADAIEEEAERFLAAHGDLPPEWIPMAAEMIHATIGQEWEIEQGDDPQLNIDALDELILDPSVHKLARAAAKMRRDMLAQWQAQMLAYQQMLGAGAQAPPPSMGGGPSGPAPQMGSASPFAGSPTSNEFANTGVQALPPAAIG